MARQLMLVDEDENAAAIDDDIDGGLTWRTYNELEFQNSYPWLGLLQLAYGFTK
jgi:hypothetical protein